MGGIFSIFSKKKKATTPTSSTQTYLAALAQDEKPRATPPHAQIKLGKKASQTFTFDKSEFPDNQVNDAVSILRAFGVPCTKKIIKALKNKELHAKIIAHALIELNKKFKLPEEHILLIVELGRFAPSACDNFAKLADNNVTITKKLLDTIINAAPADDASITNALITIADYIKEILKDKDIEIRPEDSVLVDNQIQFAGIVKYTRENEFSPPVLVIEFSDPIIDATAKADNPDNFAETIIYLHRNKIPLPTSCLKPLAENSANAAAIEHALKSAHDRLKDQLSEEIILDIIQAGENAQSAANDYIQNPLKAKPPIEEHKANSQQLRPKPDTQKHKFSFLENPHKKSREPNPFSDSDSNSDNQKARLTPRPSSSSISK